MPGYDGEDLLRGRYRLDERISRGGFGFTWRGYDTTLEIPVCIKEFFDTDPEHTEAYLKEARSLAQFRNDPGIVKVLDAFIEDGEAYLVMELLGGEDLSDLVAEQGPLSLDETVALLDPVAHALENMHAAGKIHRDVAPDNIRVLPNASGTGYTTKLMDFGSATLSTKGRVSRPDDPHSHTVIVKPGYSAPELYQPHAKLTPASDVYSLAATICFCITGKNPTDADMAGGADMEDGCAAVAPSRVRPGCIGSSQEQRLMAALRFSPEQRTQSVSELMEGLEPSGRASRHHGLQGFAAAHRRPLVATVAVAAGAVGVAVALRAAPVPLPGGKTMPNVVGFTQDKAVEELESQNVTVASVTETQSDQHEGTVVEQTPQAGEPIPSDGVQLVVSGGSDAEVSVPNVLGLSEKKARSKLEQAGLTVGNVTEATSVDYGKSLVCRQDPSAGSTAKNGDVVNLVISSGEPQIVNLSSTTTVRDSLSDYSWDELGDIADEISEASTRDEALKIAAGYNLVSQGGQMLDAEKSLDFAGSTIGMRIVDVYHDDLASGGKAGLTLMDVNAGLRGPMNVKAEDGSNFDGDYVLNVGGWESSNLRSRLQKLESSLPKELGEHIKLVLKNTNNVGKADDTKAVTQTSDALWIPSLVEVGGTVDWLKQGDSVSDLYNSMANSEGTQYAAFEEAGVRSAHNTATYGAIAAGDNRCWLRSTSPADGCARCIAGLDPSHLASADEVTVHYMLSFCL